MGQNIVDAVHIICFGIATFQLWRKWKQISELGQILKDVTKMDIKDVEQLEDLTSSNQKPNFALLRLSSAYFEPIMHRQNVTSNQIMYWPPLDTVFIQTYLKKYAIQNKIIKSPFKNNQSNYDIVWRAKAGHNQPIQKNVKVRGLGYVISDIFEVKKQYIPDNDKNTRSTWHKLNNKFANFTNGIISENISRTIFSGPVVGYLTYTISLMKGSFIALCEFDNGIIVPSITACSKKTILDHYDSQVLSECCELGILIAVLFWLYPSMLKIIKKIFRLFHKYRPQLGHFNPKQITQDKKCIICYVNCRSIIFFDCRHMIVCASCFDQRPQLICPICREQIIAIKKLQNLK